MGREEILEKYGLKELIKKQQLETVKKDGLLIKYIKNPDKEIQLEAVKQNGYAILYIENPYEEIEELAYQNLNLAKKNIHRIKSEEVLEKVCKRLVVKGIFEE